MPTEHRQIQVAKITARQAMIVALLSTISGMAIAGITGYFHGKSSDSQTRSAATQQQHWLTVKPSISRLASERGKAIRIIADVNGQAYSYPSRALFADVSPSMSFESFPLPLTSDTFHVRFDVLIRESNGSVSQQNGQVLQSISIAGLQEPAERQYPLYPMRIPTGHSSFEGSEIDYEIK